LDIVRKLKEHLPRFRKNLHTAPLLDKLHEEYLDKLFQTVSIPSSNLVSHQAELKCLMNLMLTLQELEKKTIKDGDDLDD